MKRRSTRQLATVYEVLAAATDHPTAEQIFQRVRRVMPRVSLGTVYRNLDKLREQGRLRVVRLDGGLAHFDAMTADHDHFLCEACGAVIDLARAEIPLGVAHLRRIGCVVRWHATSVYGLCRACATAGRRRAAPERAESARR